MFGQWLERVAVTRHRYMDDFVFIHINKTAGSSISKALNIPFEHKTAMQKRAEIGERAWCEKCRFCVVRNPWDKVVSHYHYRIKTNQTGLGHQPVSFKQWVKLAYGEQDPAYYDKPQMFMPQVNWISDEKGQLLVDNILFFENLEMDFARLSAKLNRRARLPHEKPSSHRHYQEYYDDTTRQIVADWFAEDINTFSYRF